MKRTKNLFPLLLLMLSFLLFSACQQDGVSMQGKEIFTLTDSAETGFFFWNEMNETEQLNALNYGYYYNGGGVAIGDINNDSLPDIYMVGNTFGGRLFLNLGNFKFKQITETANAYIGGFTNGVTMADVNNDGFLDIYLARSMTGVDSLRSNALFINNKDNTFTEQAKQYGIADEGFSTHANFFDYDKDGDLDLYVLNHSTNYNHAYGILTKEQRVKELANLSKENYKKFSSHLYRNNGNQTFTDVTVDAGMKDVFFGLSATVSDINDDGWPDLYCTSDFADKDHLYINNKNGTFTDRIDDVFGHITKNSMGSDVADFNNDGLPDIITLDMMAEDSYRQKQLKGNSPYDLFHMAKDYGYQTQVMRNCLQLNNGNGTFSEIGQLAGVSHTDWSWAPLLADFDNDGKKDLFISNGYQRDLTDMDYMNYTSNEIINKGGGVANVKFMDLLNPIRTTPVRNYLYKNKGDFSFEDYTDRWGLREKSISNGAAYADLDLDGDLDLVINNFNTPSFLYKNNTREHYPQNNYISFVFNPAHMGLLLGTKIQVYTDSGIQYQELTTNRGYLSAVHPILHFGIGTNKTIDKVEIGFPNNTLLRIEKPSLNQHMMLDINMGLAGEFTKIDAQKDDWVRELKNVFMPAYTHIESSFIDFKDEPLLEQSYSNRGPFMSVGDVNKDGWDDVYIGGSATQPGRLYVQQKTGQFIEQKVPDFEMDKGAEDGQSIFFDVDQDQDVDLYVCSGSNEQRIDSFYEDRLYINDGQGHFSRQKNALPSIRYNTQSVGVLDVDDDGDLDVIVGGNVQAKNFPLSYPTYVLLNTSGRFSKADKLLPNHGDYGIVNDLKVADLNKDGLTDIILAGDWMPITILMNEKGKWVNATRAYGMERSAGMWNTIQVEDINGDGWLDILGGNRGLNDFFKCSDTEPATLYYGDLDENGDLDAIINYYYKDHVLYPKYALDELLQQMPSWRGLFPTYEKYSKSSTNDIFKEGKFKDMKKLLCQTFASTLYIQKEKSGFESFPLNKVAQFSPLMAMAIVKRNNQLGLLTAGNNYGVDVNAGSYDASIGSIQFWTNGHWAQNTPLFTSWYVPGEVRDIKTVLQANGQKLLLVTTNKGPLRVFSLN